MKMIALIGLVMLSGWLQGCHGQRTKAIGEAKPMPHPTPKQTDTIAMITWDHIRFDFGNITSGDTVFHTYEFTNTGQVDFRIHHVKPTCGCTTADYTQQPVPPGGRGFVKVMFDSSHKTGPLQKSVTVFGNTDPPGRILTFTTQIQPAKEK
jgi:hypothetical protein